MFGLRCEVFNCDPYANIALGIINPLHVLPPEKKRTEQSREENEEENEKENKEENEEVLW